MSFNIDEYTVLLNLVFDIVQEKAGEPLTENDAWKNDAQVLSGKFFKHMLSALNLYKGSTFSSSSGFGLHYIDYSSISTIIRAGLENYLVLHWLYLSADEETCKYRVTTWELGGLVDRSKMFVRDAASQLKLDAEAKLIEMYKSELIQGKKFNQESNFNQKKILKGDWRAGNKWGDFAVSAGIHRIYFNDIYKHLCGHSHANYISALQVRDAHRLEVQAELSASTLQIACLIMAHYAFEYSAGFLKSDKVLSSVSEVYEIADKWRVGIKDQNRFYGEAP